MKKLLILLLVLAMALLQVACSQEAPPAEQPSEQPAEEAGEYASLEPVVLIGADNAGVGAAAQLFGELVTEKVAKITDGKLTIDYFPNSQLGNDFVQLPQGTWSWTDYRLHQSTPAPV